MLGSAIGTMVTSRMSINRATPLSEQLPLLVRFSHDQMAKLSLTVDVVSEDRNQGSSVDKRRVADDGTQTTKAKAGRDLSVGGGKWAACASGTLWG